MLAEARGTRRRVRDLGRGQSRGRASPECSRAGFESQGRICASEQPSSFQRPNKFIPAMDLGILGRAFPEVPAGDEPRSSGDVAPQGWDVAGSLSRGKGQPALHPAGHVGHLHTSTCIQDPSDPSITLRLLAPCSHHRPLRPPWWPRAGPPGAGLAGWQRGGEAVGVTSHKSSSGAFLFNTLFPFELSVKPLIN